MKLLFIGDIVGKPGREIVSALVPKIRVERGIDFVIANGENAAAGAGITGSLCKAILEAGVDVITLGDHVWDQKGFERDIATFDRVCRPANLPAGNPGRDHVIVEKNGFRLLVFTVLGRSFMGLKAECPVSWRGCVAQEAGRPVRRRAGRDSRRGDLREAGAGLASRRTGDRGAGHPHACGHGRRLAVAKTDGLYVRCRHDRPARVSARPRDRARCRPVSRRDAPPLARWPRATTASRPRSWSFQKQVAPNAWSGLA
jgi:hypothetical protein